MVQITHIQNRNYPLWYWYVELELWPVHVAGIALNSQYKRKKKFPNTHDGTKQVTALTGDHTPL